MNPAEESPPPSNVDRILSAISGQAAAIQQHEQILTEILQRLNLQTPVSSSQEPQLSHGNPSQAVVAALSEPKLPAPERFDGSPEKCRGFVTQCTLVFQLQPGSFPTESSKVAYIITLLTGKALDWASALWDQQAPLTANSGSFIAEMKRVFHHPASTGDVDYRLLRLSQGTRSVAEFAIEFRTLASESGWDQRALRATFHQALSPELKDELAFRDPSPDLESLIEVAIRIDHRLRERQHERRRETSVYRSQEFSKTVEPLGKPSDLEEPMQLGRTRLTQTERDRRMRERRCLYCGKPGHFRSNCPELSGKASSRPGKGELERE